MIQKFLKAQHWQLFLLMFGIPLIFQFILMGSMISTISRTPVNAVPTVFLNYMKFFPILIVLFVSVFFGLLWSIVIGLQTKLPDPLKMKLIRFKIFFFIPIGYLLLLSLYMGVAFNGFISGNTTLSPSLIGSIIAVVFPLHLFSMFCIFHTLYVAAKTVKTVELQKETTFSDFAGEFFLFWFYPFGIWIIQPKVNKMVE